MLSSLSSSPQFPPIMLFLTTTPSLTRGFMWKAMSRDLLTMKVPIHATSSTLAQKQKAFSNQNS
ncbi:hypothetical protein EYF80_023122 [Liparis tanakae]|uniref:Uncharacterized protein n=1 Tax=Liparis tanakae TaxID=230148 RepID=A0A4Z2HL61_9TELE|nr:hypothetical protein EYF80_023122 [Liparis tanakae]